MKNSHIESSDTEPVTSPPQAKLGTFTGVFTPSILTILGIILFLRLGYVTGSGGVGQTFLIIGVANLITIITSQSLSAIATNIKVKGGGDYYLISRTLGIQFGGAIGIVLYLAQSVSVAFYCIGFTEALTALPLGATLPPTIVALTAVCLIFLLAWLGSDWATKFQFLVMILLLASLLSFFSGGIPEWSYTTLLENWSPPPESASFWIIFGIFFPAVTGFTQGVSMSGDLEDPGKSLPTGTFLAVFTSILIYLAMVVVFGGVLSNEVMRTDYQAIKQVSRYDFLIDFGVFAATLSSAMASFMGGPRILQSLAADKIFPFLTPFAKGTGTTNNPRRAVLLTLAIALGTVCLGQLNLVARIVSMFFLISYGLLNYATWYEANAESPSFRPRFRWFNKYLSLLGAVICLGIILALDIQNGIIATTILTALYFYLKQQKSQVRWADTSRSNSLKIIRRELLDSSREIAHDRDWRPHILAFTNNPEHRELLLQFGHWIAGGSGTVTAVHMVEGSDLQSRRLQKQAAIELNQCIQENGLDIFPLTLRGDNLSLGLDILLQGYGIGPIHANTVLVNWCHSEELLSLNSLKFGHNLRRAFNLGCNLVVFYGDPLRASSIREKATVPHTLDVWWSNSPDGSLMLLLTYLMSRNEQWRETAVRMIVPTDLVEEDETSLLQYLKESRIDADLTLVPDMKPDTVIATSKDAAMVFLPFRIQRSLLTDCYGFSLQRVLTRLPPTALIMARREIDLDAEPEEGVVGELADAIDRLERAEARLRRIDSRVQEARKLLDRQEKKNDSDQQEDDLQPELVRLREKVEEESRRLAKAQLRVQDLTAEVMRLRQSVSPQNEP